jgi:hypothetical protein
MEIDLTEKAVATMPYKGGKKGMDRGIDGYLHFRDADKRPQFAIISVKGGGHKIGRYSRPENGARRLPDYMKQEGRKRLAFKS